jgi:hypothetical protein
VILYAEGRSVFLGLSSFIICRAVSNSPASAKADAAIVVSSRLNNFFIVFPPFLQVYLPILISSLVPLSRKTLTICICGVIFHGEKTALFMKCFIMQRVKFHSSLPIEFKDNNALMQKLDDGCIMQ